MHKRRTWLVGLLTIFILILFLAWSMPSEVLARAGRGISGGRSMGSRGSRTTLPVKPYTPPSNPTIPSRSPLTPKTPLNPSPYSANPMGGFWRNAGSGLLGGFAGGMLAHWLFGSSPAQAGPQGTGSSSGFGMLDLILLVAIGYFIYRFLVKRSQNQGAGVPGAYQSSATPGTAMQPPYLEEQQPVAMERDLETGLEQIKSMDPLFGEDKFKDQAMDYFFKIQGAWADRDMNTVKHLLTPEMFGVLQEDADKMRQEGQLNKLENIAVREVNITEAWQEFSQDYLTIRVYATLLDYSIDEKTGEIISGSKIEPTKFEEYWTFTRPVGNNLWQLSAISQAE